MSSIYRDKWEQQAREEIDELLEKKQRCGWTEKDADRYNYLIEQLDKS